MVLVVATTWERWFSGIGVGEVVVVVGESGGPGGKYKEPNNRNWERGENMKRGHRSMNYQFFWSLESMIMIKSIADIAWISPPRRYTMHLCMYPSSHIRVDLMCGSTSIWELRRRKHILHTWYIFSNPPPQFIYY